MFKEDLLKITYDFALEILELSKQLASQRDFVISNQISKSGTSIGANIREAQCGQSTADYLSKLSISLKEAVETEYWLDLAFDTKCISKEKYDELKPQINKIIGMLVISTKSAKSKLASRLTY